MEAENLNSISALPAPSLPKIPLQADRGPLGTFSRAIIVEATGHPAKRARDWAISFAAHVLLLALINMIPLFLLPRLHGYIFTRASTVVTVPLSAALPEAPLNPRRSMLFESLFSRSIAVRPLPRSHPAQAITISPPDLADARVDGGTTDPLRQLLPDPRILVVPVISADRQLVSVGGDIEAPTVIASLQMDYPESAIEMGVFGKVVIHAIIDETGKVEQIHPVSGPVLLRFPAMHAVSQEKFQPAILNGIPTRCDLEVVITFRMY